MSSRSPGAGRRWRALAALLALNWAAQPAAAQTAAASPPRGRAFAEYSSSHFAVRYDPQQFSRKSVEALADRQERVLAEEAARLGVRTGRLRMRILLDGSFSEASAEGLRTQPFSVTGNTIEALLAGYLHRLDPQAVAEALLDQVWGEPGTPLLGQWAAGWLASGLGGSAAERRAAAIETQQGHYRLVTLVARRSDGLLSPLARAPLGAAWMAWVNRRLGLAGVRRIYLARVSRESLVPLAAALGEPPAELERAWRQWMARLDKRFPTPAARERRLPPDFFFRGVSLSSEGWSGGSGYGSERAAEQIRLLKGMGANAIALVPYGFMRAANDPRISYTETDESDRDVSEAAYIAHRLGMKVMLKPQLWMRGGKFTGEIRFARARARQEWFRNYREFILHYARLAEERDCDLLSIGNELGGTSDDEPEWRALIAAVRRVYHGPLTYAANWKDEFGRVRFWDALDYAGLNNYAPLATAATSEAIVLTAGAEGQAAGLARFYRRWRRPILFTEVGYPSVATAAVKPWMEDGAGGASTAEQAACYEAVFRVFTSEPWLRGMFWWKWRSDGASGGAEDTSYVPAGKPAAEVLRRWYTRLAAAQPEAASR